MDSCEWCGVVWDLLIYMYMCMCMNEHVYVVCIYMPIRSFKFVRLSHISI